MKQPERQRGERHGNECPASVNTNYDDKTNTNYSDRLVARDQGESAPMSTSLWRFYSQR